MLEPDASGPRNTGQWGFQLTPISWLGVVSCRGAGCYSWVAHGPPETGGGGGRQTAVQSPQGLRTGDQGLHPEGHGQLPGPPGLKHHLLVLLPPRSWREGPQQRNPPTPPQQAPHARAQLPPARPGAHAVFQGLHLSSFHSAPAPHLQFHSTLGKIKNIMSFSHI